MDHPTLPDWELLNSPDSTKKKRKREPVSFDQRQLLLNFISENPELVTHSSTRESEQVLWEELTAKLNKLQPEKTLDCWRQFWKRWKAEIKIKHEASLTVIDQKLIKFLDNIGNAEADNDSHKNITKKESLEDINEKLKLVEAEKMKVSLQIDTLDYKLIKYKKEIQEIQLELTQKKKINKKLILTKNQLNNKRRRIIEKQDQSINLKQQIELYFNTKSEDVTKKE